MRLTLPLLVVCCLIATIKSLPVNFEEVGGYFQGDMDIQVTRNGVIEETLRWPNSKVHYKVDKIFDEAHLNYIRLAMREIEKVSCIRFFPATAEITDYIDITGFSTGCHAEVGYQGKWQSLNLNVTPLGEKCFRLGTIIHEFLHALGFHHQQSAPNRNKFVKVLYKNIITGKENNFDIYETTDFGIPYDYGSVMHYPPDAFSKDGISKTVIPFDKNAIIGQRRGMSPSDIKKLNIMYKCPLSV